VVIVGKAVGNGNFVRRQGENRAYSVEPSITLETEPRFLDRCALDRCCPPRSSKASNSKPPRVLCSRCIASIRRTTPSVSTAFRQAQGQGWTRPGPSPSDAHGSQCRGCRSDEHHRFRSADPGHRDAHGRESPDAHRHRVADKALDSNHIDKDADLTAKTQGRAFEIASYRYDEVFKPLEQLLEALPPKTPAAPKGASKAAPAAAPVAKPRPPSGAAAPPHAEDKPASTATPVTSGPPAPEMKGVRASINGASAGFGRRFAALIYDGFLLAALLMTYTGAILIFTRRAILPETYGAWVYLYRAGLIAVIAAYYVLNWMRSGQTLGNARVAPAGGKRRRDRDSAPARRCCGSCVASLHGRPPPSACSGCTSIPITWPSMIDCPNTHRPAGALVSRSLSEASARLPRVLAGFAMATSVQSPMTAVGNHPTMAGSISEQLAALLHHPGNQKEHDAEQHSD